MTDLSNAVKIANSGMKAQSKRMRVISENLANADSLPSKAGEDPYRRKVVTFKNEFDRALGANRVQVDKIINDESDFVAKLDPSHPAADADGYVMTPNVNPIVEMMDMREAQRSYEANLQSLETARDMMRSALSILQ